MIPVIYGIYVITNLYATIVTVMIYIYIFTSCQNRSAAVVTYMVAVVCAVSALTHFYSAFVTIVIKIGIITSR